LNELFEFSKTESGLIVGKPGVGKSFLLNQLKNFYLNKDYLSIMIRIDNLIEATDSEIQQDLGLEADWIETFKKIKIKDDTKALLIFDAFDAARNETLRTKILKQIQRAKNELSQKWNIIVSVRTYDASKSQKLIELFPSSGNYNDNIYCRKTVIPSLTDEEVTTAIESNVSLLQFYNEGTQALKSILKIPFFLNIADKVIPESTDKELQDLKKMESETQLLKIYWLKRIINTNDHLVKEQLLLNLTNILVVSRSLSCSLSSFIPVFNPGQSSAFEYLRSENIVDETSVGERRIAFSHNILFDYAVSTLYLQKDIDKILDFINEEPSRPFFLRPSFVYFFTQLWYEDNANFWSFFWRLNKEEAKEIKLFVRLVLTGVIAAEYNRIEDLEPLFKHTDEAEKNTMIRNTLQSIRFVRKKTLPQDIDLLEALSRNLKVLFLWDLAFLLDRAVNDPDRKDDKLSQMGLASRNFLAYTLDSRKGELNQQIDRLGATRGVELVCKTYSTDQPGSKALLQSIFEMLQEHDFEIYYFSSLSEYIKDILAFDSAFVAEVYRAIFGYIELSTAQTSMGSGVTMNLLSNRKQDFELCYYRLTEFFDTFISHSPSNAIPVGLDIVNDYIIKDRGDRYMTIQHEQFFELRGARRIYMLDLSSIWANNMNYHKPATIANKIIEYIANRYEEKADITPYLDSYIKFAKVGYTWKLLIGLGVKVVDKCSGYFFEFCICDLFLTSSDTSYETGRLIETGATYFTDEQLKQIEEKIHEIAEKLDKKDPEFFRRKFLSRLPIDKLQLPGSRELLEQSGTAENEKPYQSNTTITQYTTEMWLEERGVDLDDLENRSLLDESDQLKVFNDKWRNDRPSKEELEQYFINATKLFEKIKNSTTVLNDDLLFSILSEVAQTYATTSRNIAVLDNEEFASLKEAIWYCYNYMSYSDKVVDEDTSPSRGYAPTPRIIAAEALAPIASRENTPENLDRFSAAIHSNNSIVRYNAVKHARLIKEKQPEYFNKIMYESLGKEKDAFVASTIMENIPSNPYNEAEANKLLKICTANESLFKFNNIFLDNFTFRVIWLYTTHKNALADKILNEAYLKEEFCRTVIFNVFEDFRMSSLKHYSNSEFFIDSSIKWILNYLDNTGEILKRIPQDDLSKGSPTVKSAINLFDTIVQRIFFVFERKQYGNRPVIPITDDNRNFLYRKIKPVFEKLLLVSSEIPGGGFIVGHTAHYFIQTLSSVLFCEPKEILSMVMQTTKLSYQMGYTFDSFAIREMVILTEKLLADHRGLLMEKEPFNNLIQLLDLYMESGWTEALELLWKLDEIFK
jgi:hypothetical protein